MQDAEVSWECPSRLRTWFCASESEFEPQWNVSQHSLDVAGQLHSTSLASWSPRCRHHFDRLGHKQTAGNAMTLVRCNSHLVSQ